jgi:4-diphosphocytidyl-2-C-methyl-D-erythritol kinase
VDVVEPWYVVLIPNCHVNTGEIFCDPALTRNSKTFRIRAPLTWEDLGNFRNDCESIVLVKYPEINQALNWLSQYGKARITGTGCCVFSAFSTEEEAKSIASKRPKGLKGFVARGVNQSPGYRAVSR